MLDKNNATIKIVSIIDGDNDDRIELVVSGGFYEKNSTFYIMYEEKKEMDMADCSVMIKVHDDEMTVTRKGEINSKMFYKSGKTSEFLYQVPYGTIPLVLNTKTVEHKLNDDGGIVELDYSLIIQQEEQFHRMSIEVKVNT